MTNAVPVAATSQNHDFLFWDVGQEVYNNLVFLDRISLWIFGLFKTFIFIYTWKTIRCFKEASPKASRSFDMRTDDTWDEIQWSFGPAKFFGTNAKS